MSVSAFRRLAAAAALLLSGWVAAPSGATTANDLCAPAADPCVVSTVVSVSDGSIIDVGARELRIAGSGSLDAGTGMMTLQARVLTVQANASLRAVGNTSQRGGTVEATADSIVHQGNIDVSGSTGGRVKLTAQGALQLTGPIRADALATDESGGDIDLAGDGVTCQGAISAIGGRDSLGGDITITADGDLTVGGTIDATGGDGGDVSLFAGSGGAGNMAVSATAQIKVDGSTTAGFGGEIDVEVTGNGLETGQLVVDGMVTATGRSGSFETGGGAGGDVSLSVSGDIRGASSARYSLKGGGPDGEGGDLEFDTTIGVFDTAAAIDVGSDGTESGGGSATWDVAGDIFVRGPVSATAGDAGGGDVDVESSGGNVSILAPITANGTTDGSGGTVCLASGTASGDVPTSVIISSPIMVNGGGAGAGGSLEADGVNSVRVSAALSANGGTSSGRGGAFALSAVSGSVVIEAAISATATGAGADGGTITVDSQTGIVLNGDIDVRGQGGGAKVCSIFGNECQNDQGCVGGDPCLTPGGGDVDFTSTGPIDLVGDITASSSSGRGGRVSVISEADVAMSGNVVTDGSSQEGGRIDARACLVTVCGLNNPLCAAGSTATLSSLGGGGTNRLAGRGRRGVPEAVIAVLGTMRGDTRAGRNELVYDGTPVFEPVVFGTVTPAPVLVVDASLEPCPVCGNREIEAPETCDDGNQNAGDGCSSICQLEAGLVLGDVNGTGHVDADDVADLVTEIFDGDGDLVARMSSSEGRFLGFPGGDANQDERINAADVVGAITRLGTP